MGIVPDLLRDDLSEYVQRLPCCHLPLFGSRQSLRIHFNIKFCAFVTLMPGLHSLGFLYDAIKSLNGDFCLLYRDMWLQFMNHLGFLFLRSV